MMDRYLLRRAVTVYVLVALLLMYFGWGMSIDALRIASLLMLFVPAVIALLMITSWWDDFIDWAKRFYGLGGGA